MRENILHITVSIGIVGLVLGFIGFGYLLTLHVTQTSDTLDKMVFEFAQSFKERDERLFSINSRVQTLEEQRDIERRLTDVEEQLRVYCTSNKTEMCGRLRPTK